MKKMLSMLLAVVMVFSLAACGDKQTPEENDTTEAESVEESAEESVEESTEESTEDAEEETPAVDSVERKAAKAEGEIAKIGLGTSVKLDAKEAKEGKGDTTSNVTIAGLAFDNDGKIVEAYIDVAQSKFKVTDEGTFEVDPSEATFKTKVELGDEYNMKPVSEKDGIGKEYYEQAQAFAEYILGKTADEVVGIKTKVKDENHQNVPDEADLVSSVTIDIAEYQKAVKNAWDNAKDVEGATKLGLGVNTSLGHATKEAADDKGATVQYETVIALTATDDEGKIVSTILDTAQNSLEFDKDGGVVTDLEQPGTTKKALGEEYGMRKASEIKKEWFEQIEGLEKFTEGKTADELSKLELEDGKPTDADLLSTTTIVIETDKQVIVEAAQSAE